MRASLGRTSLLSLVKRKGGYVFLACVFFVFLQAGLFVGHTGYNLTSSKSWTPSKLRRKDPHNPHPIPELMEEARKRYRRKLRRQSGTLEECVTEYKRRYGRDPPRGFGAWWKFAERHGVIMVDEYDTLAEDLKPFWELDSQELRRRTTQVGGLPSINMVRVQAGNVSVVNMHPEFKDSEVGARAMGFASMLSKFVDTLPDIDFPINSKAEGRVLVPWEHRAYPNLTVQDSSKGIESVLGGPFQADWEKDGNVWDSWRRTCPPNSPARRFFSALRNHSLPHSTNYFRPSSLLPHNTTESTSNFAPETAATLVDFCSHPDQHYMHGHFFSDWRTISALYPVFSPAKAQGFLDIRIPSHYYYANSGRYTYGWDPVNLEQSETDKMEVDWEQKEDRVFWRGATTGGGNHPTGWAPGYQRHRFLRMSSDTSNTSRLITFPNPNNTSSSTPHTSSSSPEYLTLPVLAPDLNTEIMDTAFVTVVGEPSSFPGGIDALKAAHRFGDAVLLGAHWRYKYLVDLDGMGYSGRFMAFLASGSAPLKATVYEEYWRDWLEPWLHYIPLSSSYDEIYSIYAYFSGPTTSMVETWASSVTNVTSTSMDSQEGQEQRHLRIPTPLENIRQLGDDRRLRSIAEAGRQWKKTVGRKVDMEVYVYRLALEWARLVADDRDAMNFKF